jgi:hypothetical protein
VTYEPLPRVAYTSIIKPLKTMSGEGDQAAAPSSPALSSNHDGSADFVEDLGLSSLALRDIAMVKLGRRRVVFHAKVRFVNTTTENVAGEAKLTLIYEGEHV